MTPMRLCVLVPSKLANRPLSVQFDGHVKGRGQVRQSGEADSTQAQVLDQKNTIGLRVLRICGAWSRSSSEQIC